MINHPNIQGVSLEIIKASDFSKLLVWRNNPRIFKWCRQNDLIDEAQHSKWFDSHADDKSIKMYAIHDEAQTVGVCGLTSIDLVNQRAEFSLYIAPEHHGRGLGERGLKLLLWHGFNAYPLNIIWGESFDGNRAIDTFKRVGFKQEGVRRDFYFRDGKFIDAHLFSIKRDEVKI